MSQYARVPNLEAEEDVQVVELQVPSSSAAEEPSTSPQEPSSPPPSYVEKNSTDHDDELTIEISETVPMVNQTEEHAMPGVALTADNTGHGDSNSDDSRTETGGGFVSRFPLLNKLKRKPNNAQSAPLSSTDGVFANLSAKPGTETEKEDENPPSYEQAAADQVPPYLETTIIAPGILGDELLLEGLPVGNFFSFVWNMLVSMSFQFVGFLLTYLLHTSHAAKNGSRAGLGITLVQYGFYLRGKSIDDDYSSYDYGDNEMSKEEVIVRSAWLSYILMFLGWFIVIRSISDYVRAKRMEMVMRTMPEESV